MFLNIQGLKCKKHVHPQPPNAQPSQLLQPQNYELQLTPKVKQKLKKFRKIALELSIDPTRNPNDIILAADLPSVPFYMPKLSSKTPPPLRLSISKTTKLRMNLYSPTPKNLTINALQRLGRNVAKTLNNSLNVSKKVNDQYLIFDDLSDTLKKFKKTPIDIHLPKLIISRKNVSGVRQKIKKPQEDRKLTNVD